MPPTQCSSHNQPPTTATSSADPNHQTPAGPIPAGNLPPTMTPAQKALLERLDGIIEQLAELTTLLEASFDTQPEIEADPLADHPELPLATTTTDQP